MRIKRTDTKVSWAGITAFCDAVISSCATVLRLRDLELEKSGIDYCFVMECLCAFDKLLIYLSLQLNADHHGMDHRASHFRGFPSALVDAE